MKYLQLEAPVYPNPVRTFVLDIETDSLTPTVIWCVCVKDVITGEIKTYTEREKFLEFLRENPKSIVIGHNLISFDVPVLNRLWGCNIDLITRCLDTLVLSYLYKPALDGGHSLEAWGQRLKFPKGDFSDWSHLSEEMISYCKQDVELTYKLYCALTERMRKFGYSELSCEIEHRTRIIIDEQERNGFHFARERASLFRDQLRKQQADLAVQIQRLFPPRLEAVAEYSFRRTKAGSPVAQYEKHRTKFPRVELSPDEKTYTCYDYVEFNLGSPKQRVERLLELGWVPTKFTPVKTDKYPEGFPKVDEDALVRFQEELEEKSPDRAKVVGALADWLVLQGRASMLDTWFNNLGADSRIHGKVITCGASTRRATHHGPNSANIPSGAKAKYGKEVRSFWCVTPNEGLIEVGVDASGLENVGLLHYLNNPKATEVLGKKKPDDVHSLNARFLIDNLKLGTYENFEYVREWSSKTGFYAILFGCGDPKLASIIKGTVGQAKSFRASIIDNIPGFADLLEEVSNEFKFNDGRIRTVDSGIVWCPSFNAALNYRIQSLGAIVMKLAIIILHEEAKKIGLWFRQLGWIHDELQMETKQEDGDRLGKLAVWSIEEAARRLKFRVPLTGAYKLGTDWSMCH